MGIIVDALTDRPVANAQVTLGGTIAGVNNTEILTDAEGRFVFLDLRKGTYTITATKAGYADGAYGRRRPGGLTQTLSLADAERIGDLKIPIWKHAAITGTIRDEAGEPMVDLPVRVLMPAFVAGKLKLTPGAIARTDDRGVYRIGSLAPGDYVVVVPSTQTTAPQSIVDLIRDFRGTSSGPGAVDLYRDLSFSGSLTALNLLGRSGRPPTKVGSLAFVSSSGNMRAGVAAPSGDGRFYVYPTQYFPAAMTASQATTITLQSGEERTGVDVQLKLVPTSRVSGTVTGPTGPLMATMTLSPDASELVDGHRAGNGDDAERRGRTIHVSRRPARAVSAACHPCGGAAESWHVARRAATGPAGGHESAATATAAGPSRVHAVGDAVDRRRRRRHRRPRGDAALRLSRQRPR